MQDYTQFYSSKQKGLIEQIWYADRTSELRRYGYQGRRLGPKQMTTDTAVRVTRMVVEDKRNTL